jgi:Tfp pilus assembly protein PilF
MTDHTPSFARRPPRTNHLPRLKQLASVLALCIALAGCATTQKPQPSESGVYDALYDGKSEVAYATELPVSSAAEAIQLGDAAMRSGDLDKALFQYIRGLNFEGNNPEALFKIGLIHGSRGNTQLAETAYRWALASDPNHAGALGGLGIILMKQRNYEEATAKLTAANQIDPRMPGVHNALGILADMDQDYARAQGHYESALAIVKDSPEVLNNLGYSRYLGGNRKGAITAFQQALRIDPNYERAWRNLGLVYARDGQYDKALDALSKVQDMPKAYNDVGYVAMLGGRLSDAEGFFDEAMRLSPHYYELAGMNSQRVQLMKKDGKVGRR